MAYRLNMLSIIRYKVSCLSPEEVKVVFMGILKCHLLHQITVQTVQYQSLVQFGDTRGLKMISTFEQLTLQLSSTLDY